ncbi:MAG: hypothetical protein ACFFED_00830 [Candidatus Thorarchaeota archaeon]
MTDESKADPKEIKKSLDDAVKKLDQDKSVSERWGSTTSGNKERWEALKVAIKERQHALKELVREKKSGTIGQDEFDRKFRVLQDELTELEFQVYNLRLGTDIKM